MGLLDNLISSGKKLPILQGMDSVVGENAGFKGEITTTGSININGQFEGKIKAEGEVIVSPGGKVTGEIHGGTVIVSGRVDGNISARDTLEVSKAGRVHGDLTGGKIIIEEGSTYQGRVKVESGLAMAEPPEEPPTAPTDFPPAI